VDISLDMPKRSKGYRFYYPYHIIRIVESRNLKFLENNLISRSDQLRDLGYEIDYIVSQPSTLSERLVVIHIESQQMIDIP